VVENLFATDDFDGWYFFGFECVEKLLNVVGVGFAGVDGESAFDGYVGLEVGEELLH